jgi:hypothetical protein
MKTQYTLLNEKLEREIQTLKNEIQNQVMLSEVSSGNIGNVETGIDSTYDGGKAGSLQNRGYISGLQGANSDAIVANPTVIAQTVARDELIAGKISAKTIEKAGTFGFEKGVKKPILTNNIGLGMGLGLGDKEFSATKEFVDKYAKNFKLDNEQQYDPNEIGYLSWKAVNDAVSNREAQKLQQSLQTWGLYNPTEDGAYPTALGNQYNDEFGIKDPSVAFAKKLKKTEDSISGKPIKEKGKSVNGRINKVTKSKK